MATANNDFETNLLEIFWAICNFMEPTDVSNAPSSSTNCHKLSMSRKINCQPDNSPQNSSKARELGLIPIVKEFPEQDYQRRTFTELGSSSINNRIAVQHILPSVNQYVLSPFNNFTVEPSTSGMNIDKNLVFQKKRFNKRRTRRSLDLSNNANIYNLNEDLQDIEVTLTSLKAIDVGPLCSTKTNLTSLLIKFNTLYRYILLLQNERNKVETLLNVNMNEKYIIPPIHGIRSHIEFARKSISFELSKMLAVFKLDHFRIDDEMMEHMKNLLNNLNVEMLKLNIFENINCFQRNRECIKPDGILSALER